MKNKLTKIKDYLLNLIFPSNIKCIFCEQELNIDAVFNTCPNCVKSLPFIKSCCDRCGTSISEDVLGVCEKCKNTNYNFVQARSVFSYNSLPLKLVRKVKFRSKKIFIESMAKYLFDYYSTWNISVDFVTYVPMHPKQEKLRGFNQAKLLAKEFSNLANLTAISCCSKVLNTPNQRQLSFAKRQENVKDSFKFNKEFCSLIKGKTLLIIDDVFTTGATTSELSKTIISAGAKACYVLTFAHTELNPQL